MGDNPKKAKFLEELGGIIKKTVNDTLDERAAAKGKKPPARGESSGEGKKEESGNGESTWFDDLAESWGIED